MRLGEHIVSSDLKTVRLHWRRLIIWIGKLSATGWDGHPLTVTLARANSPTRPIAGPTRSSSFSGHTLPYGEKFARHSIAGSSTPDSPVTAE